MKTYEFRLEEAIADIAFFAYGKDLPELFANACKAVTDAMVEIDKIDEAVEEKVDVQADTVEKLLYNTLEEVVFLKDAKQLVFKSFAVDELQAEPPNCQATITMKGEKIDRQKHQAHADVKAVTMKDFGIEKIDGGYRASVILDI